MVCKLLFVNSPTIFVRYRIYFDSCESSSAKNELKTGKNTVLLKFEILNVVGTLLMLGTIPNLI